MSRWHELKVIELEAEIEALKAKLNKKDFKENIHTEKVKKK